MSRECDRLGYWGIYNVVKELAEIAGVKDAHPHQGRHGPREAKLS
jgi:hypothetical protein